MADTPSDRRVIAYWDFENLVRSLEPKLSKFDVAPDGGRKVLTKVAEFVQTRGYVFINRSFANWPLFGKQGDMLKKLGVEVISEVSVAANGKNGADIQLVIDAVQTVCDGARVEEAILLTGDSDFVPLAIFLRSKGIRVVGVSGSASAARLWREQCDEFFLLEDILGIPHMKKQGRGSDDRGDRERGDRSASGRSTGSRERNASSKAYKLPVTVRRRMIAIVGEQQADAIKEGVNAGALLQQLQTEFPRFDYKKSGAERWSELVKSLSDDFVYAYTDAKVPQLCIRTRKPYKPRKSPSGKTGNTGRSGGAGKSSSTKSGKLLTEALATLLDKSDKDFVVPARLGHMLKKLEPDFDVKAHGYSSLKEFVVAHTGEAGIEAHEAHGYVIRPTASKSTSGGSSRGGSGSSSGSGSSTGGRRGGDEGPKKLTRSQEQAIDRFMRGAAKEGQQWADERELYRGFRSRSRARIGEGDFWAYVKRKQLVLQDVNGAIRATERPSRDGERGGSRRGGRSGNGNGHGNGHSHSHRNGNGDGNGAADGDGQGAHNQRDDANADGGFFGKMKRWLGAE